ncbi:MAG: WD40 repeat domain-containing protein, partial [Gammaproteobacteria bacterium]
SGGLTATTYLEFQKGGRHGTPFVAGHPEQSLVLKHLTGEAEPRMPMGMEPLSESEINSFRQWILQGAQDDSALATGSDPAPSEPPVYQASPVITALAYSPDGKVLAVSGNHEVLLHKTEGSGLVARLVGQSERIHSIAFSPDGKTLAAVGGSPARFGELQLWDLQSIKLLRAVKVTADTLFGVSFSPDGKYVSFGCPDKTVRVFDSASGAELKKMEVHSDWVFATVFSLDGKRVVSVSRDHFLKLSEVATGSFLENLNLLTKATFGGQGELYCLARHPKRDVVVAAGDDRVPRMYTMNRPRAMKIDDDSCLLREFEVQSGMVQTVAFSPDGAQVAVGGRAAQINIYLAENGNKVTALTGHTGDICAVAFHPGGTRLAAAGFDGIVRIYDLQSRSLHKEFVPVPLGVSNSSSP